MFLIKFFYFLQGYVIIKADGKNIYRFFNLCSEQGINIYNIVHNKIYTFTVLRKDLKKAVHAARKSEIKINRVKICGLPKILSRLRSRLCFTVGAALFVLFFSAASMFLWSVEVDENCDIDPQAVKSVLSEIGVKPGVPLCRLPDRQTMKEKLINSFDNVPWAWVYINGVRAKVVLHSGTVAPIVIKEDAPCDIAAKRDGFIVKVSSKKGMKLINEGNAVNAGDIVISGYVDTGEDKPKFETHAEGDVLALTSYKLSESYSLTRENPIPTGRKKSTFEITFFSKELNIFSPPEYDFFINHEKSFHLPFISINRIIYEEAEKNEESIPPDWMEDFAKRDLSARIASQLSPLAQKQSESYSSQINGNKITVTAEMSFIENIGTTVPR